MKIKVLIFSLLCSFVSNAQDIPEHICYTRIYDFLDELAGDGIIEINSVAKPYARVFIAEKLRGAKLQSNLLNKRQQNELQFFLNEFALEQNTLPETHLNIWKNELSKAAFIQPAFHYRDSVFRARITPILGMHITRNNNGNIIKRWYGAEFHVMMGTHFSVYGSLRDISFEGPLLARPQYLNDYPGCEYKESTDGGDFSDSRGGIKYSWNWGSVGLVKDNVIWGDNYHGSNILSGRTPSFPMLTLHLKPTKWFEFQYLHGWLVSNVIDSTRYYTDNVGSKSFRMANKFIAANLFTFTPVRHFNVSFGNSIVYAESNVHPAYLIPFSFYKSMDHALTKGLGLENQNSQVFVNLSSRNIKHLHLYAAAFADEVSFSRFLPSSPDRNPISYKVGAKLSNFLFQNFSMVGEYTRNSIIVYKHSIPALTWTSNSYNLGHYLGDNSEELYFSLLYKPLRGLDFGLSYINAKHGNEYDYLRRDVNNVDAITRIISQPSLGDIVWSNKTFALNVQYELFNNAYALVNIARSEIRGYDAISTRIEGEATQANRTAQKYLDLFTPTYLQGQNTTVTVGFSFGF